MKTIYRLLIASALTASAANVSAQTPTGSDYLEAYKKANCTIAFDVNAEGTPFRVKWGMDTAWDWSYNVYRGIAHIEDTPFETGRISFQPNDLVTDNGDGTYTLSTRQINALNSRINHIKLTGTTEVNINCDHEMLFKNGDATDYTGRDNYQGKPEEWYKLIKATVQYAEKHGLKVVSVSPFNEPDYTSWMQYSGSESKGMSEFLAIAKLLKEDEYFKDIRICGGNTLNCDRALPWYNALKDYLDEGNTHQLAGSFDTYANFFATVKSDGKIGTGDELHNVGEAIVGVNYGMENGIWWGFDSKARGQFMQDSNEGVRLGYGENRNQWTNGAVYRNEKTGEVHGYFGSSERQANSSSIAYLSKTRDVYYNGYGPTRMFVYDIPGGTGYQSGQINAERLFDITWGEDVAPGVIDGTYQIMNAGNKYLLTMNGSSDIQCKSRTTSGTTQQWNVYPIYTSGTPENGANGDISYWCIDNVGQTNMHVNSVLDWGQIKQIFTTKSRVITYSHGTDHPMEEQWYLKYAKDGYYYIINRLTNKYLYCNGTSTGAIIDSRTAPTTDITERNLRKYLWRFMPTNARAETTAPKAPTQLTAKRRPASIELSWAASVSNDANSYIILRGEATATNDDGTVQMEWNTIGRNITATSFVDNTALPGHQYTYKLKTVDLSGNRSDDSETLEAQLLDEKSLICQIQFDDTLSDNTANRIDARLYGNAAYSGTILHKSGTKALNLSGTQYAMLPNAVGAHDEMTIAMWVRWAARESWQRIFDFGSGEDQYMFFTPSNGSQMRFVMKNGGEEEILTTGKSLQTSSWHHIAITIKPLEGGKVNATLYIDGENSAETSDFTILPSDIRPAVCYIGRSQFAADPLFNGRIDDFRIYNYALNEDEVKTVMDDTETVSKDVVDRYEDTVSTSIHDISSARPANHSTYDLNGRQVVESAKGIVIKNGKKIKQ